MSVFPFFIELKNKKCIVIGGGTVAERKIETLLSFNAQIEVISLAVNERIREWERAGRLTIKTKKYCSRDLAGAFAVIAATDDSEENEKIYNDALKKGILVNVVDCREKCTFIFPSILKRGNMVLGISTSGDYPALSKYIRLKLEKQFSCDYGEVLEILTQYRTRAQQTIGDKKKRAEFLTKILDYALEQDHITLDEIKAAADSFIKRYTDEKEN